MPRIETLLNVLIIYILAAILLAAFGVQLFLNEKPCPLCLLQRVGMLGIAAGALLNLNFGSSPSHYGIILLSSLMGGIVALRQIALHICPGSPSFGIPVLGLSLYTWSFFIFVCTIAWVALNLFTMKPNSETAPVNDKWVNSAFLLILLITVANAFSTFQQCRLSTCGE